MDVDSKSRNGRWLRLTGTIARQVCEKFDSGSSGLLEAVVQTIARELTLPHTGLVQSREGRWQFVAVAGSTKLPPADLLAASADDESVHSSDNWLVSPITFARRSHYLLTLQTSAVLDGEDVESLGQMVSAIGPVILMAIRLANTIEHPANHASATKDPPLADGTTWIGRGERMRKLRASIERIAATDLPVLILGENGTGKEVASRMIHNLSTRRGKPFLAVNCAALSQSLLESELFGHEAGAFTDAKEARAGKFELAANGTLFLDEIGDLSLPGQSKLLRAIEEKVVVRVGGWQPIKVDARIIAATNRDVPRMVHDKVFREDLFYRLNTVILEVPPLRERTEDIIPFAEYFLDRFSRQAGRKLSLTASAKKQLTIHNWPGNVRELRNMIERLTFLVGASQIDGPRYHQRASEVTDARRLAGASRDSGRRHSPVPGPPRRATNPCSPWQHDRGRKTTGPPAVKSLPKDAPTRHVRQ